VTNEKPVSLHPLEFEEALAALLGISPDTQTEKSDIQDKKK
jgi:peroxiredoxin